MDKFAYTGALPDESLHRYTLGGYHPVHLGDVLKDGRYKVMHKLGVGGYSTLWAAKDLSKGENPFVAIKITVAELHKRNRELKVMRSLETMRIEQALSPHLMPMLDHFSHTGPNGVHDCLVLELLGQNIPDFQEIRCNYRLPGGAAKRIAKQALSGIDCLHQRQIAHGDLHTRNLVLSIANLDIQSEEELMAKLGAPETSEVRRKDGLPLEPGVPKYLVWPSHFLVNRQSALDSIRIIDFGEAFLHTEIPDTLHTPLVVRAPEVIFKDRLDYRVDLWSMGCMLFELVTGQPPFDSIGVTPTSLIHEILGMMGEELPERWQTAWRAMQAADNGDHGEVPKLQDWLEEVYFDSDRDKSFTREDICKIGELLRKLLRLEPSKRASAREILEDPWFDDV